jgi:hypothetical protein
MNLIPIHSQFLLLVVEEAVVLVHDAPKCLVIALFGVIVEVLFHTGMEN